MQADTAPVLHANDNQKPKVPLWMIDELGYKKIPDWLSECVGNEKLLRRVIGGDRQLTEDELQKFVMGKLNRPKFREMIQLLIELQSRYEYVLWRIASDQNFAETTVEAGINTLKQINAHVLLAAE